MKEKKYEKRLDFQQQIITKQFKQIELLETKIERLEERLKEKDEIISSVEPMRREMTENLEKQKVLKNEYEKLIQELRQMKKIMDVTVYKGKWRLVKFLIK